MKLEYRCPSCKATNYYTPVIATRGDLHMKIGDNFDAIAEVATLKKKYTLIKLQQYKIKS